MRDNEGDIAISVLNKLIAQELEAASSAHRFGNRSFEESASIRYHAYLNARDKIREVLAEGAEKRDEENPFQCQRDELVTMDMHTCDLCGKWVPSPVYPVLLAFNGQSKTATEVCADCMKHLKFKLTKTVPMEAYRDYEQWVMAHPKKNEETQ